MPHSTLKLIPGVDENRTMALNEAALSYSNLIRFVPDRQGIGLPQKLGGWTRYFPTSLGATPRAMVAWEDTNNFKRLAIGCQDTGDAAVGAPLYVLTDSNLQAITPQSATHNITASATTVSGSSTVTINDTASNITSFDSVFVKTHISVGGIIIFGFYQCTILSANSYQINLSDALGYPVFATSGVTGGSVASFTTASGSNLITATLNNHGFVAGNTYPILVPTSVGGINLSGNYVVLDNPAPTTNTFTFYAQNKATSTATVNMNPATFNTVNGSNVITTDLANHSLVVGSTYSVPVSTTVGGIAISGSYTVATVINPNRFTFIAASNATSTASAISNNGNAQYLYYYGYGPLPAGTGYGVGGYGTGGYGSGVAPTAAVGTPITTFDWSLDHWGDILVACPSSVSPSTDPTPSGGAIYTWSSLLNSPTATPIVQAPSSNGGIFVAMPQRQIVAWASTFNGIQDPLLIRWCDVEDYQVWAAQPINQAGSYRLTKGSKIVGAIQGPQQGLIWTDLAVWSMQYVGQPYIYQFNELGTGCGLIAPKAATSIGNSVFWMGPSQFYTISGNGVQPVQCPIWDVIFQDLDQNNLQKIRAAPNSQFNEVTWYYPTMSDGGEINAYVKYSITLNQWDFGSLSRTAWINQSVLGPPIGTTASGLIYQHETSPDADGQPMNSSFQTGYFTLSDGDMMTYIDQFWPDAKWGTFNGVTNANLLLTFYVANYPGDTPITYGPFTVTQATQYIVPRFRGRLVSIKVESNDIGSFWRMGAMRYRYQPDGKF
jgi:hypothetical protein